MTTDDASHHTLPEDRKKHTPYSNPKNDISVLLTYRNISLSYNLSTQSPSLNAILTQPTTLINNIRHYIFGHKNLKAQFHRLAPTSGFFTPGQSTLVLSPPGSGRSTILKLVTKALPPTTGDVLFNGVTQEEALDVFMVDTRKMLGFVDQIDNHFSELSVYETLEFAHRLLTKTPSRTYIENMLEAFGMEECTNTLTSQISGGQKRRLSLMLGLCNPNIKCVAMDNLSDGLDHATADSIIEYLCHWAKLNNSIFLASLQQPAPSMFQQFDETILLRDGYTVYHGPVGDVEAFLGAMGYPCDEEILPLTEHIIHVLSHPKVALQEIALNQNRLTVVQGEIQKHDHDKADQGTGYTNNRRSTIKISRRRKPVNTSYGPLTPSLYPCMDVEEMVEFYEASPFYQRITRVLDEVEAARKNQGFAMTEDMISRAKESPNLSRLDGNNDQPVSSDDANNTHSNRTSAEIALPPTTNNSNPVGVLTPKSAPLSLYQSPLINGQLPPISTEASKEIYQPGFAVPLLELFSLVLDRQVKLTVRNPTQIISRMIPGILIAFVFSGLYYKLPIPSYNFRAASFIDVQTEIAYNNLLELGLFIWYRQLIHSQLNLYPTYIYTIAVQVAGMPYSLVEAFLLTVIPYSMIGHSPYGLSMVTHFFMIWIHGLVMTAIFRVGASLTANVGMAYAVVSPTISVLSLVSGFYMRRDNLPYYLWWLYYISPFTFGLRSLCQLEFLSPRYDYLVPSPKDASVMVRAGEAYLQLNGIATDPIWILMSALYCVAAIIILIFASAYFLYAPHKEYSIGTRRFNMGEDDDEITLDLDDQARFEDLEKDELEILQDFQEVSIVKDGESGVHAAPTAASGHGIEMSSMAFDTTRNNSNNAPEPSRSRFLGGNNKLNTLTNELPFTPATLSFESIKFTVKAQDENGKQYDRVLLQNVSGYAQPGTMIALMGSSGAGKSTLLNTLIGFNKTTSSSRVEGMIYVNGEPVDGKAMTQSQFTSITAYVEQFETLWPFDTVYETLLFSARSRLKDVDEETLQNVVNEVIDILELTHAKDLLIGNPENPVLSPSQKKRVAIGVELVANPLIIFLDEPTTGLDSESAASVVRALGRIARAGRAILCTIHQPSSLLFHYFDALLLLGSGGFPLYFGRMGKHSRGMISYFNHTSGFDKFPHSVNPAEWLVQEVSKPMPDNLKKQAAADFAEFQQSIRTISQQHQDNNTENPNDNVNLDMFLEFTQTDFDSLSPKHQWIKYLYMHYMKSVLWGKALQYLQFSLPDNKQIALLIKHYQSHATTQTTTTTATTPALGASTAAPAPDLALLSLNPQQYHHLQPAQPVMSGLSHSRPVHDPNSSSSPKSPEQQQEQRTEIDTTGAKMSLSRQFYEVTRRTAHIFYRSPSLFYTRLWSTLLLSFFFGIFYLRITVDTTAKVITFLAATVITIGNSTHIMGTTALPLYVSLKPVFHREIFSSYYQPWLWPISFMLSELLWSVPMSIGCFLPNYLIIGAELDPQVFFSYWLVVVVMIIMFTQFSLFLSMTVPPRYTEVIQNFYVSMCFSFANIAITYPNTTKLCRVFLRILPFFYVNRAISTQQFKDKTNMISVYLNDESSMMELREYVSVLTGYRMDGDIFWWSLLWLCVTFASFGTVAIFSSIFIRVR